MISTRRGYVKNIIKVGILFLLGIVLLFLRNPDPFINPIVYAEDGVWVGMGLTKGWYFALIHARSDYFVLFNVAFLFIAAELSSILSGSPLELLPESIGIVSLSFFSGTATAIFFITKKIAPTFFRIVLYLLLLLIPLGVSQNEIIGRLLQVGFYVPLIAVILFYLRGSSEKKHSIYGIDFLLFLCAATNPVVFGIWAVYLLEDLFNKSKIRDWIYRNSTLIFPVGILLIILLPRLGGSGGIPGELVASNIIEAIIARPILYPYIFPWYSQLTDSFALILFLLWVFIIFFGYFYSSNIKAKRLILFSMVGLIVFDLAAILMRPGLTGYLSNYQTTFPDRYFMGINALSIMVTIISLSQISIVKNWALKIFGYSIIFIFIAIYACYIEDIFEVSSSKLPLMGKLDFYEQLCMSETQEDSNISLVQIYPEISQWKMSVPSSLVNKSGCKYIGIDNSANRIFFKPYKVIPTKPLNLDNSIKISMLSRDLSNKKILSRIGIMFGTNARHNLGEAELRLNAVDGSVFLMPFALNNLEDNKYHYFDIDLNRYLSGEIVVLNGGGVATYESYGGSGQVYTCLIYEYSDGEIIPTPGCPPYEGKISQPRTKFFSHLTGLTRRLAAFGYSLFDSNCSFMRRLKESYYI